MTTKKLSSFNATRGTISNQNVVNKENVYAYKSLSKSKDPNSGGIIVRANGYVYHVFKQSGVFTWNDDTKPVDILLVGGGGSGGSSVYGGSGGGGAGGVQYLSQKFLKNGQYAVAIGAGGIDNKGSNTTFNDYTALGGGQGGTAGWGLTVSGQSGYGGSGGGGANHGGANSANMSYINQPNEDTTGSWTSTDFPWLTTMWSPTALGLQPRSRYGGKGNRGGAANNGGWRITTNTWVLFRSGSAGGGGAGDVGANALYHTGTRTTTTGAGGTGTSDYSSLLLDIDSLDIGDNVSGIRYIAGGGGGGLHPYSINVITNGTIVGMFGTIPAAAYGGGGRGGQSFYIQNTAGKANSGGGGGGGSGVDMWAAAGGSGVAIIRYSEKVY